MTVAVAPPPLLARSSALDRFRGLAVLLMLVDHLCLVFSGPVSVRLTLGRLALPMFFILAGHLSGRPRGRTAAVGLLGVLLGLVVPWIDSPNVLTIWAVGVCVVWLLRRYGVPLWLLPLLSLTLAANGWGTKAPGAYDVLALWGLMGLGALVPRASFGWSSRLPGLFAGVGRHPVAWYAGHVVLLDVVVLSSQQGWPWLR